MLIVEQVLKRRRFLWNQTYVNLIIMEKNNKNEYGALGLDNFDTG